MLSCCCGNLGFCAVGVCVCVMLCACLGGCVYDCELGATLEDFCVHFVVLVFGVWHVVGLLLDL